MKALKMRKHTTDGLLIVFCGLDGCGKSTIIKMLAEWLEGYCGEEVFLTKQPTDFVRQSKIFRTYMDEPDHDAYDYRSLSLLAASDRLQHCNKVILPMLEQGKTVISDRYFYSCAANLRARGYEKDQWIYEISRSVIKPDISIFLDIPVETAISRVRNRPAEKDKFIDVGLQYRLREEFLLLAQRNKCAVFGSSGSPESTFKMIKKYIFQRLGGI